ncbi:MAG: hypothetical protein ABIR15_19725 [Chitinophagaceae bacterium]
MLKVLLLTIFLSASVKTFSQASDFITVKKKNNRTVKTFFPGVYISFETYDKRQASGLITAIRSDSVFVREYDIRQVLNFAGIPVLDTLGQYLSGFNYKEIAKVDVSDKMKLQQVTAGRILIIGGTGYALLNVINGAYLHESVTSSKNLKSLGIAAGAVGTGLLINYLSRNSRKYHVEYIHMEDVKKHLRGF